jgi:hypothetical protein
MEVSLAGNWQLSAKIKRGKLLEEGSTTMISFLGTHIKTELKQGYFLNNDINNFLYRKYFNIHNATVKSTGFLGGTDFFRRRCLDWHLIGERHGFRDDITVASNRSFPQDGAQYFVPYILYQIDHGISDSNIP